MEKKRYIVAIAAMDKENNIGYNGDLLARIPEDMETFAKLTRGSIVVMGRKTFESLPNELPDRVNVVMSRDINYNPGVPVVHSKDQLFELLNYKNCKEYTAFIIGGGEIYKLLIDMCDKIIITEIDAVFESADTKFPDISTNIWEEEYKSDYSVSKNGFRYRYKVYAKKE
jgi:dihydrofolate reductase